MKFSKSVVVDSCNNAIAKVKENRRLEWEKEINKILNGKIIKFFFRIKTREDAIKYIEEARQGSCEYLNLERGWGTLGQAETLIAICKVSLGDEILLNRDDACFVSEWSK